MDIKEKINALVSKAKSDKKFRSEFMDDPVRTVKNEFGVNLSDGQINTIIDGVKAKLAADKAGGFLDNTKNLF